MDRNNKHEPFIIFCNYICYGNYTYYFGYDVTDSNNINMQCAGMAVAPRVSCCRRIDDATLARLLLGSPRGAWRNKWLCWDLHKGKGVGGRKRGREKDREIGRGREGEREGGWGGGER